MTHLNLLPTSYRCWQTTLRRLKQWLAVWAVAALVIGGFSWRQWSTYRASYRQLVSLREQSVPARQANERVTTLTRVIDDMLCRQSLVLELSDEQSMFTLIAVFSRATRACAREVSIQSLVVQRRAEGQRVAKVATLDGFAPNNQAIASFVDELRGMRAFRRVELKNSGIASRNNVETRTYSMECVF